MFTFSRFSMDPVYGGNDGDDNFGEFEVWDQYEDEESHSVDETKNWTSHDERNSKGRDNSGSRISHNRDNDTRRKDSPLEDGDGLNALTKVVEALKTQRNRGQQKEAVDSAVSNILKSIHTSLRSDDTSHKDKRYNRNVSSTMSPDTAPDCGSSSDYRPAHDAKESDSRDYYRGKDRDRGSWNNRGRRPFRRPWVPRSERRGGGRGWRGRPWRSDDDRCSLSESSTTDNSYNRWKNVFPNRNDFGWGAPQSLEVEDTSPFPPATPSIDDASDPSIPRNPSPPHLSSKQRSGYRNCEFD